MGQGFIKKNGGKLTGKYEQLVNYTMLYDSGDECSAITGGWEYTTTQYSGIQKYQDLQSKTFQKNADHIYLHGTGTNYYNARGGIVTANKISMQPYNAIFVKTSMVALGTNCLIGLDMPDSKTWTTAEAFQLELYVKNPSNSVVTNRSKAFSALPVLEEKYVHIGVSSGGYNGAVGFRLYNLALFKADNWSELASIIGVGASSISALLTNSNNILSNKDAVNFMVCQCTGDFMANAIQNNTFMTALSNSPYKEKVYANKHWSKFLAMVA